MTVVFCLECGYGVNLGARPHEGQRVICAQCGTRLEVISLRPLELDWGYDEPYHNPEEEWQIETDWEES